MHQFGGVQARRFCNRKCPIPPDSGTLGLIHETQGAAGSPKPQTLSSAICHPSFAHNFDPPAHNLAMHRKRLLYAVQLALNAASPRPKATGRQRRI